VDLGYEIIDPFEVRSL